jgi:hypothetical protein
MKAVVNPAVDTIFRVLDEHYRCKIAFEYLLEITKMLTVDTDASDQPEEGLPRIRSGMLVSDFKFIKRDAEYQLTGNSRLYRDPNSLEQEIIRMVSESTIQSSQTRKKG